MKYPVEISQEEKEDGCHTVKVSIGGKAASFRKPSSEDGLIHNEWKWNQYKDACEKAQKNSDNYDLLESYREMFGAKSSTAVHADGWKEWLLSMPPEKLL